MKTIKFDRYVFAEGQQFITMDYPGVVKLLSVMKHQGTVYVVLVYENNAPVTKSANEFANLVANRALIPMDEEKPVYQKGDKFIQLTTNEVLAIIAPSPRKSTDANEFKYFISVTNHGLNSVTHTVVTESFLRNSTTQVPNDYIHDEGIVFPAFNETWIPNEYDITIS